MAAGNESAGHVPVLAPTVVQLINVQPGETVVDATIGLAGHARMFAERLGPEGMLVGLDVDPSNLEVARRALIGVPCRVVLLHANFAELREAISSAGLDQVDVLFGDLGVSSNQLDDPGRGLSFQHDGSLDMRLDPRLTVTAAGLVNRLKERELSDLFYHHAQEFAAGRIARRICEVRRDRRITSTVRLAEIVADAVGVDPDSRKSKIHPATRVFLALRMAVNHEVENLKALLARAPEVLRPGGRFGVITFHSVEDKPVKLDFRKHQSDGVYRILTKKPMVAEETERRENPRSRSAKLRAVVRLPHGAGPELGNLDE